MKTNENVLLAHGWKKGVCDWNFTYCRYYSKQINNWDIFIMLNERDGDYWLELDDYPSDVETYIAVAEELKLLNVDPDHKIISTERKDLEK